MAILSQIASNAPDPYQNYMRALTGMNAVYDEKKDRKRAMADAILNNAYKQAMIDQMKATQERQLLEAQTAQQVAATKAKEVEAKAVDEKKKDQKALWKEVSASFRGDMKTIENPATGPVRSPAMDWQDYPGVSELGPYAENGPAITAADEEADIYKQQDHEINLSRKGLPVAIGGMMYDPTAVGAGPVGPVTYKPRAAPGERKPSVRLEDVGDGMVQPFVDEKQPDGTFVRKYTGNPFKKPKSGDGKLSAEDALALLSGAGKK